jgi:hypothetical protein
MTFSHIFLVSVCMFCSLTRADNGAQTLLPNQGNNALAKRGPADFMNGNDQAQRSLQDSNKQWIDGKLVNPSDYLNGSGRIVGSSQTPQAQAPSAPQAPVAVLGNNVQTTSSQ